MPRDLDPAAPLDYHLDPAYTPRLEPRYFVDDGLNATWQPDVYPEAAALARRLGAGVIVDFGCGTASKLVELSPEFEIVGIDFGDNIRACRERYDIGTWVEADFDAGTPLDFDQFEGAVLVCADVIEHLVRPELLLRRLRQALDRGAFALVLSTPDRTRSFGEDQFGPPLNEAHVREWSASELESFMASEGLRGISSLTRSNDVMPYFDTILAVVPGDRPEDRAATEEWALNRRHWEVAAVQTEEQYRELQEAKDWLSEQREAWEQEAREQLRSVERLSAALAAATARSEARSFWGRLRTAIGR
jgi:SAM-dependent methyltransferase